MRPLILLLLLPLLACSHEHPLTDRQHDHNHHYPFPDGLPFAYILSPIRRHGATNALLSHLHRRRQHLVYDSALVLQLVGVPAPTDESGIRFQSVGIQ